MTPEVFAHLAIADAAVCLNCERICQVSQTACPCCTGNKLVPLAEMKRTIVAWAEDQLLTEELKSCRY